MISLLVNVSNRIIHIYVGIYPYYWPPQSKLVVQIWKDCGNSIFCLSLLIVKVSSLCYLNYVFSFFSKDRLCVTVWFWTGGGLLKLHDDIQTCGYEDVQVMWEMLRRSDSDLTSNQTTKRKQRPFWRVFVLSSSNRSDSSSFAPSHGWSVVWYGALVQACSYQVDHARIRLIMFCVPMLPLLPV